MDTQLLQLLIQSGASGILIFMVYDMRREAKEQREQIWSLLKWLVEQTYPGTDAQAVVEKTKPPS